MAGDTTYQVCPVCGNFFICGVQTGEHRCWCFEMPSLSGPLDGGDCRCPACLRIAISAQEVTYIAENLDRHMVAETEPEPDFYYENGYLVFTECYLRKRGYCCGNGCRHCPYKQIHND